MLNFDFGQIASAEFGIGRDNGQGRTYSLISVDGEVQDSLAEMASGTWNAMRGMTKEPPQYEPSEKYASQEYVFLPLANVLGERMRELHTANNILIDGQALSEPMKIFCYFARFTDRQGQRLTALRRATQFKGVLKSRLLRFDTDALKIVKDKVFKLDTNFDILIDAQAVHVLRPSGFEFVGQLQDAVLSAVPSNVQSIQAELTFVDFASIEGYASAHPRAARYLASIRSQKGIKNIDRNRLQRLCAATGVDLADIDGNLIVHEKHVMGFLEVLDRRRYEIELVADSPEKFRAASRIKI
ncbi:MAG: DUF4868 domain-containing protein [Trichloromonas sp.]|jgi:hypothetical protein|nr:DUF4868 domain-containing protein [Trichloromonas sp.]